MNRSNAKLLIALIICGVPAFSFAQVQEIRDYLINVTIGVRTDVPEKYHANVVDVTLEEPGFYRMIPKLLYNSGDDQLNESCFFTVLHQDSTVSTAVDSNAGPYKVIPDDPGPRHTAFRDAGLFYFLAGTNTIQMHHYSLIADQFPQFLNGSINGPESIKIVDTLKIVAEPRADALLNMRSNPPRRRPVNGVLSGLAYPGESIYYELIVKNHYLNVIRFAQLELVVSPFLATQSFTLEPSFIEEEYYLWDLPHIDPGDSLVIGFYGNLADRMQEGYTPLVNRGFLRVPNEADSTNNKAESLDYAYAASHGGPPDEKTDMAIRLFAKSDSFRVFGADTAFFVSSGEKIIVGLAALNNGVNPAHDVQVRYVNPPLLFVQQAVPQPSTVLGDTLIWNFSSIDAGLYQNMRVETLLEMPGISDSLVIPRAFVSAIDDTAMNNNAAEDSVFIFRRSADFKGLTDVIKTALWTDRDGDGLLTSGDLI
ncbi:hypothetical protein JW992_01530, partial [candidate division KSB1 bacterium]|nr:hypothetical protein [candidate division KSB1 bacterium]